MDSALNTMSVTYFMMLSRNQKKHPYGMLKNNDNACYQKKHLYGMLKIRYFLSDNE
jgi:hypothetical protein